MNTDNAFDEEFASAASKLQEGVMHEQRVDCTSSKEDMSRAAAREELRRCLRMPLPPVPHESLQLLRDAACQDTGGSQACRYFLFWLVGQSDPTGYQGAGGFELRRLDGVLRNAAIEVLSWWAGPTKSSEPLHVVLASIRNHFDSSGSKQIELL